VNHPSRVRRDAVSVAPQLATSSWMTIVLTSLVFAVLGMNANAQVQFDDVSDAVGLSGFTESWGSNIGDLNGDNCLDIFVNGHRDYPRVYRNTCTGEFEDIATEMDDGSWMAKPQDDKHGGAFGDFDNDGDEDLLLSVSVSGAGQLWVNNGDGTFFERASSFGLTQDVAARFSTWIDFTNDGKLDALSMGLAPWNFARYQTPTGTFSSSINTGHECGAANINYMQMLDITGDGTLEFLCVERGVFPNLAYDTSTLPFTDVTAQLPSSGNVNGSIIGDFDGNLRNDILLTRGATRPAGAAQVNNLRVEAWVEKDPGDPPGTGFRFVSGGAITVTNWSRDLSRNAAPHVMNLPFGSSEQCSDTSDYRVCAAYNAGQNRWEVYMGGDGGQSYIVVDATATISGLANVGESNRDRPIEPRLYLNTAGGFVQNNSSGLNVPLNCGGGAAADFDNDMDVDLYLSCGAGPENLANRMYINDGSGNFTLQVNSGAEGPVGVGFDLGVAENTVFLDYDLDGFLDLFVTNGLLYYPWGLGGPDILLHNQGNANHWLQLDLIGTSSNSDGIGAKVYVTAGSVEQLREQNGGYNRWGQNQQWLHFGLGPNLIADITIRWPSGAVDVHTGVAADILYSAVEGGALTPQSQGTPIRTVINPGDECGEPAYDYNFGPATLLWKDCGTNTWHFRAKGGRANAPQLQTQGSIIADTDFSGVVGFDLDGGDSLSNAPANEVVFDVRVSGINDQGFDFDTSGQSTSCLDFSRQDIDTLIIGSGSKQVKTPIDLATLWVCGETPPPSISIADASANEDDGTMDFTVALSEITAADVNFRVSTQDVTASYLNGDYTRISNQVFVIPAGDLAATVTVAIGVDASAEIDEEFFVGLSNVTNSRIAGGFATGTIINDDGDLPQLSVSDGSAFEDTGEVDVFVTLDVPALEDVSFSVLTAGQTASFFQGDYNAIINETFVIPAGDTSLTITIELGIDTDIEDDEFLFIGLSNFSTNVDPIDALGVVWILDDDTPSSTELSISDAMIDEDAGTITFDVLLSATDAADVTFDASTTDGTATTGDSDYSALVNAAGVITAGSQMTTVTVLLGVDATPEPDETFTVTLSNVSANAGLASAVATGTILDDDTLPDLTISDAMADEDTGTISFTVLLNEAAAADVTFDASTTDGSATTADSDYTALVNDTGTITAGNTSTTVTVLLGVDGDVEPDQDFTVTLTNVSPNANLLDGVATGTITNDDFLPDLSIGDIAVDEDTGTISFTVSLNETVAADVTFNASTSDGTATTADNDYTALVNDAGTVSAGNLSTTVTVSLGVDIDVEPNENFTVTLTSVSPNANLLDGVATGTINNDDVPPAGLSISDANADEDTGTISFDVTLIGAAVGDVIFDASTSDGSATTADSDYTALVAQGGTITSGNTMTTVTVSLGVDIDVEPDEDFTVTLTNVSVNAALVDGVATGTINNDDALPDLSIADTSADEDTGSLSFTVSLDQVATADVTFGATTVDGSATTADSDYTALIDQIGTITAGNLSTTVTVTVGVDAMNEPDETLAVTLANVSPNANLLDGVATGTILNDDAPAGPIIVDVDMWLGHQGGVSTVGNQVIFDGSGPTNWSSSVYSAPLADIGFTDDYEVRFTIVGDPNNTIWVAGLGVAEGGSDFRDIDYGLRSSNGQLTIYENGTWRTSAGTLANGDEISINVSGGSIEYRLNDNPVFTSTYAGTPGFYVDTAFKSGAIALDVVVEGDAGPVDPPTNLPITSWVGAAGGVSATGDTLSHTGSPSWTNTINSVTLSSLGAGSAYTVSWEIDSDPNGTIWVVGLGVNETNSQRTDIEYGLRSSNGNLEIRLSGNWAANIGTLSIGDVLAIRVDGTALEFRLNGTVVSSTTISGSEDFYIDTAFKNGAINLGSFTLTQ